MNSKQINILFRKINSSSKKDVKIIPSTDYTLYFDGCSKGNPGPAGIGAVIYKNSEEYWASCIYLGSDKTNNESEYSALIHGLNNAVKLGIDILNVYGDSLLVINQVNGVYKVKNEKLFELYGAVLMLKKKFSYITFNHVYRENNKRADQLSNLALLSLDRSISLDKLDKSEKIEDNTK
jgi:ribonuclease HI